MSEVKAVRSFALLQHVCRDVSDYFNVVRPHMFPHTDAMYCLPLRLSFANGHIMRYCSYFKQLSAFTAECQNVICSVLGVPYIRKLSSAGGNSPSCVVFSRNSSVGCSVAM